MIPYISVFVFTTSIGFLFEVLNRMAKESSVKKSFPPSFTAFPIFFVLFIMSALRGDFTTDYENYTRLFHLYNSISFSNILNYEFQQEIGYLTLSKTIGLFTDNEAYLFVITSFIILFAIYSQFKRYSPYVWLSVLLFISIGSYYTSFNVMRQILASSIIFAGSKYLYERKFIKYCLVVIFASLFHKTALIMVVFYFILNMKLRIRNFIFILISLILCLLFLDRFLILTQTYLYTSYTEDSYGLSSIDFNNALVPLAILVFCMCFVKKTNLTQGVHRIWINAVIFYTYFEVLGTQIQLVQRLSEFFSLYVCLLVPMIFKKIEANELKVVIMIVFIIILFSYNYYFLYGAGYNPYYFFWNNR